MTSDLVTAEEMAKAANIDPKRFRSALRKAGLGWHEHYDRWTVQRDSPQHEAMLRILRQLSD